MPPKYPNWKRGVTPHTNAQAGPSAYRAERGVTAIRVKNARYRNSQPLNGVFQVVDPASPITKRNGQLSCQVHCSWFGVKPFTCHPHIIVQRGSYTILPNYTGRVIDDIS